MREEEDIALAARSLLCRHRSFNQSSSTVATDCDTDAKKHGCPPLLRRPHLGTHLRCRHRGLGRGRHAAEHGDSDMQVDAQSPGMLSRGVGRQS